VMCDSGYTLDSLAVLAGDSDQCNDSSCSISDCVDCYTEDGVSACLMCDIGMYVDIDITSASYTCKSNMDNCLVQLDSETCISAIHSIMLMMHLAQHVQFLIALTAQMTTAGNVHQTITMMILQTHVFHKILLIVLNMTPLKIIIVFNAMMDIMLKMEYAINVTQLVRDVMVMVLITA